MKTKVISSAALAVALLLSGCQGPNGQKPATADPAVGLHGEPLDAAGQNRYLAAMRGEGPKTAPAEGPELTAEVDPALSEDEGYVQVERLARPAINEGLLVSNSLLNLFNMVPPAADTTPAAKPIADEATFVLKAFGNSDERIQALFGALLPDVMRIDTTLPSGYATLAGGVPVGGRLLTDDVVDITLSLVLPPEAPEGLKSDAVAYDQTDPYGDRRSPPLQEFPYVPEPF